MRVGDDEWWDTTGIDIVAESVVDDYMRRNPGVGVAVLEEAEEPEESGITRH